MPKSLNPSLWPLLARFHAHRQTHSEWKRGLGSEGMESVPLVLAKGERADFIRCRDTGIPLEIHENWNGSFSALPPVDTEFDSRIDDLTLNDLRVYAIDWSELLLRVQQELRIGGRLRQLSFKPPLWHLGTGIGISQTCFFSILSSVEEVWEIVPFLKSDSGGLLLLPTVSDPVFAALTREGILFHVMDSDGMPAFTDAGPAAESLYCISRHNMGWRIVFNGGEAFLADRSAMPVVAYLLKNPPQQPIHVLELEAKANPGLPVVENAAVDIDADGLFVMDRLKELNLNMDNEEGRRTLLDLLSNLRETVDDPDASSRAKADAEKQANQIQIFLNNGGPKHSDQASKAYDRVRNQLNRVLKKLRAADQATGKPSPASAAFADHLNQYMIAPSRRYSDARRSRVKAGVAQTFTYEPPSGVVWTD